MQFLTSTNIALLYILENKFFFVEILRNPERLGDKEPRTAESTRNSPYPGTKLLLMTYPVKYVREKGIILE